MLYRPINIRLTFCCVLNHTSETLITIFYSSIIDQYKSIFDVPYSLTATISHNFGWTLPAALSFPYYIWWLSIRNQSISPHHNHHHHHHHHLQFHRDNDTLGPEAIVLQAVICIVLPIVNGGVGRWTETVWWGRPQPRRWRSRRRQQQQSCGDRESEIKKWMLEQMNRSGKCHHNVRRWPVDRFVV